MSKADIYGGPIRGFPLGYATPAKFLESFAPNRDLIQWMSLNLHKEMHASEHGLGIIPGRFYP
jgi:hypothetical protein